MYWINLSRNEQTGRLANRSEHVYVLKYLSFVRFVRRPDRCARSAVEHLSAWPFCSHEGYDGFRRSPGRVASSEAETSKLNARKHRGCISLSMAVVGRKVTARHLWNTRSSKRRVFLGSRQKMKGKMSHIANHCQEKSVVECCGFLANRPGRYA